MERSLGWSGYTKMKFTINRWNRKEKSSERKERKEKQENHKIIVTLTPAQRDQVFGTALDQDSSVGRLQKSGQVTAKRRKGAQVLCRQRINS